MPDKSPILVTGAAGSVGAVGRTVVELLRDRGAPVRAFVRREDERAEALRATGAEVFVGDLTLAGDVGRAMEDCRRVYFGMGVSAQYLQATVTAAAVARGHGRLEAFVNMSQMTVSQMTVASTSESIQQRQHWLAEQVLNWSGLPVVHVRPTVFMENPIFQLAYASIRSSDTIRLPFGSGKTSPIAARDVAEVVATLLMEPSPHLGNPYHLTGANSRDMTSMAAEFSASLGRTITYVDVPYDEWVRRELAPLDLPGHVFEHLSTMARLHQENRYDRATDDVGEIIGRQPSSVEDFVESNPELFAK
ncbi:NAD(P)H-binding protein [Streptomyces sp. TP-A0356]|uniref:NAD(P)H-binding protein n=1 Tax=Streptomyces sp. TP-A0356 TaxID=1359208 RepID=UPI0006E21309|nr:NAD(P)H-binding protein [Streptomyces sp. TP-A0356]